MSILSTSKSSDTVNFTSSPQTGSPTSATTQIGGFDDVGFGKPFDMSRDENVPAASRTTASCADSRFKQVGTKQQYALTLKMTDAGVTLVGGLTDAQNNVVTAIDSTLFVFGSRNNSVATIGASSGIIVPRTVGGVGLYVRFPQGCVNKPFDGARPVIGAGFSEAAVQLTITN